MRWNRKGWMSDGKARLRMVWKRKCIDSHDLKAEELRVELKWLGEVGIAKKWNSLEGIGSGNGRRK